MALRKQSDPKVMDVARPKPTSPSMTSRPIIVPNRPMIAEDPMIAKAAEAAANYGVHSDESEQETAQTVSTAPIIKRHGGKAITPLSIDDGSDSDAVQVKKSARLKAPAEKLEKSTSVSPRVVIQPLSSVKNDESAIGVSADEQAEEAVPSQGVSVTDEPKTTETSKVDTVADIEAKGNGDTPEEEPSEETTTEDVASKEKPAVKIEKPAEHDVDNDPAPEVGVEGEKQEEDEEDVDDDTAPAEDEDAMDDTPEDAAVANLENLILTKKYFIPVHEAGRRRKAILFGSLLIVLLLVVMLDVLLDMGVISLSGIPHTTFFQIAE